MVLSTGNWTGCYSTGPSPQADFSHVGEVVAMTHGTFPAWLLVRDREDWGEEGGGE